MKLQEIQLNVVQEIRQKLLLKIFLISPVIKIFTILGLFSVENEVVYSYLGWIAWSRSWLWQEIDFICNKKVSKTMGYWIKW